MVYEALTTSVLESCSKERDFKAHIRKKTDP